VRDVTLLNGDKESPCLSLVSNYTKKLDLFIGIYTRTTWQSPAITYKTTKLVEFNAK